ncbi:HAMP domain-containing protein [Duganella sp. BJB488]|uniref:heavy metal sensor histidine kinase n=1 Tax=unclassified Duganella TaxID=2636909 RepID=UPI000E342EF2|nr:MULTISPECIES: heavy metal sensor histidine kinase [unclassified Duganella]RFP11729.1 HAMP domain-containing protein [Duganella sp. BJB489]RFP15557.1 HAMP domain-containing protein [Duganella sp. BJB488]RFP30505.1 HAMP domain-containing protein [Duganella sp. BJB480]
MNRPGYSLTAQLGALFAIVAVIVFSAVGFYLYRALAVQLQERDEAELVERVLQLRHLLAETSDAGSIQREPHRFLDAVDVSHGLFLVIQTPGGQVLVKNTAERGFALPGGAVAADATPSTGDTRHMIAADGAALQVLTAMGRVGTSGDVVRISVACTAHERQQVLRAYRLKVWIAAIAGAMLTAATGYFLVHRGLARVRALAAQAQEVTARNLDKRLDADAAPAELRLLADSFNLVLDRLQNSFNNLSQFADDLAHDLRTPLNNLMVQTEVVFSQPRDIEEYQNLLSSNHEEFGRLARMVESMLFLARADHDQVALSTERLDAAEELGKVAEYFEGLASEADVRLTIAAQGEVWADGLLLRRAVSNLVANAVRYTPPGCDIVLAAASSGAGTTISVTNSGPGIDPAHLPRVFDRFYRSDQSRSSQSSSAGLGLAIVKSIMALHGGHASATSELSGKTRFALFFPGPAM